MSAVISSGVSAFLHVLVSDIFTTAFFCRPALITLSFIRTRPAKRSPKEKRHSFFPFAGPFGSVSVTDTISDCFRGDTSPMTGDFFRKIAWCYQYDFSCPSVGASICKLLDIYQLLLEIPGIISLLCERDQCLLPAQRL